MVKKTNKKLQKIRDHMRYLSMRTEMIEKAKRYYKDHREDRLNYSKGYKRKCREKKKCLFIGLIIPRR